MTSAAGIAGGARSRRRCRRSALKANLRPTRSTVCCFVTVTICVPFVLVLSPARPADRRAGSTTPLRSRSAIWLAMAALPVSTSHRDAGWHVADPDTDGGTAETRADERLNTVAAQQARRWAPGPPTRSEMDAGGSRLGPRVVGTSRGWDLAWLGPRVVGTLRGWDLAWLGPRVVGTLRDVVPGRRSMGQSTWVVEYGRGRTRWRPVSSGRPRCGDPHRDREFLAVEGREGV